MLEKISSVIALGFIVFIIYARYVEPYRFNVKHVSVENKMDLKIVHIADVHFGKNFRIKDLQRVVDTVNELEKDLIVFTGDFFDDHYQGNVEEIVEVLLKLECEHKYAVWGNHDYKGYAKGIYAQLMEASGFKLLVNEDVVIESHHKKLMLVGSDDYIKGNFDKEYLDSVESDFYTILLLHEPDIADNLRAENYDLILSGHSHGGQVVLPFGIHGRARFGSKYREGLFILNHRTSLYVSSGLGTTGMRLRFNAKPSISVLEI